MKKINLLYLLILIIPKIGLGQCTITSASQTGTNTSATTCVCPPGGGSNCDLIPDISIAKLPLNQTSNYTEYPQVCNPSCSGNDGRLRVGVSTPIIGYGPLETRGTSKYVCGTDTVDAGSVSSIPSSCPGSGLPPKQLINQRIYRKNGSSMNYYERPAGSMTYHASHGHQHIDDWGIYTLRTNSGDPNPLNWPIVGTGSKLGFCLIDLGTCQGSNGYCTDAAGNTLNQSNIPNYGLGALPDGYSCSNTVQGITNGYMDTYSQSLDGMWINIPSGTCNGTYYLVIQIDPYNYFLETNESNNVVAVPITLTKQTPGSTATVTANKTMPICAMDNVTLTANTGTTYLWSNGATTQSITVAAAGSYTVTVTNVCGTFSSSPFVVTTTGPNAPTTTGNAICGTGSMSVNATGNGIINWYSTSSGATFLNTGGSYLTPVLSATTTYYADATTTTGGSTFFSPPSANTIGAGAQYTGNQYLIFDVSSPSTLKTVKLYANAAGTFTIQLLNSSGSVINSTSVTVPAGESRVTLNFPLSIGTGYRLTRSGSFSLYRNNGGVVYPYNVTNYVSITGSSGGSTTYYFFYDWEILTPTQTCTSARAPAVATIKTVPTVSVSPNSSICQGSSTSLTASGASTYSWSPSSGLNGTSGSSVTANPNTTSTYTVIGTATNGCTGSNQVTVTVKTNPTVSVTSNTNTICIGQSATLTASGATSYSWSPSTGLSATTGSIVNASPATTTTYTVTGNANGCEGTNTITVINNGNTIPAQVTSVGGQLKGVCEAIHTYTASVSGATTYTWTEPVGSNLINGQGTGSVQIQYPSSFSNDSLCVIANNVCGNSPKKCFFVKAVPANPTRINGAANVCANQLNVSYTTPLINGATSYVWKVPTGAVIVNGQGTRTITVNFGTSGGNITVKGKNNCGSGYVFTKAISINCKLTEASNNALSSIELFPNPAKDFVEVQYNTLKTGLIKLTLMDITGRELVKQDVQANTGENKFTINLKDLSKGLYIILAKQDGEGISKRLIVD